MKKNIFIFLLGGLICSVLTAGASHVFDTSDISYNPKDETWNVNNADSAINDLKSDLESAKSDINISRQESTS